MKTALKIVNNLINRNPIWGSPIYIKHTFHIQNASIYTCFNWIYNNCLFVKWV